MELLYFSNDIWGITAGAGLSTLLLLIGHFFRWGDWLGRDLTRLEAYAYGVICLWLGYALWRLVWQRDWVTPLGLLAICGVAGGAVCMTYRLDTRGLSRAQRRRRALVEPLDDDAPPK